MTSKKRVSEKSAMDPKFNFPENELGTLGARGQAKCNNKKISTQLISSVFMTAQWNRHCFIK